VQEHPTGPNPPPWCEHSDRLNIFYQHGGFFQKESAVFDSNLFKSLTQTDSENIPVILAFVLLLQVRENEEAVQAAIDAMTPFVS
jgi:hypothetical protein